MDKTKEKKKEKKGKRIRVSRQEYACTFIGHAYATHLFAYTCYELVHAYTP